MAKVKVAGAGVIEREDIWDADPFAHLVGRVDGRPSAGAW